MSHIQRPFVMKRARFFTHIMPDRLYCWWYNRGQEKIWHVKSKKEAKEWLSVLYWSDLRILRTIKNLERMYENNQIPLDDVFLEVHNINNVNCKKNVEKRLDALYMRELVTIKPSDGYTLTSKYWMYLNIFKWCINIITGIIIVVVAALLLQCIGLSNTLVIEIIKTLG